MYNNFEYGVKILDAKFSNKIYDDIFAYSQLGSNITPDNLKIYLEISEAIKQSVKEQQKEIKTSVAVKFKELFQQAENQLVKEHLNVGPVHNIFSNTILYILEKYGGMQTEQLHFYIKQIHPDLCDDSIDRVIDGKHYSKKWKHYVMNSQQHLKSKGLIELTNGIWKLI